MIGCAVDYYRLEFYAVLHGVPAYKSILLGLYWSLEPIAGSGAVYKKLAPTDDLSLPVRPQMVYGGLALQ